MPDCTGQWKGLHFRFLVSFARHNNSIFVFITITGTTDYRLAAIFRPSLSPPCPSRSIDLGLTVSTFWSIPAYRVFYFLFLPCQFSGYYSSFPPPLVLRGDGFPPHLRPLLLLCSEVPILPFFLTDLWVGAVFTCVDSPGRSCLPLLPHISFPVA